MTKPPATTPEPSCPATYEIRLKGHLDPRWTERLGVPRLTNESDGTTILHAVAADQSALHGVLQRLRDLGLPLISVTRVAPGAGPT